MLRLSLSVLNRLGPRSYSMWPPQFVDPASSRSELAELRESGEFEQVKMMPVKAAPKDAQCSLFGDPLVLRIRNTLMCISNKERADLIIREAFRCMKATQLEKRRRAPPERRSLISMDVVQLTKDAVANARPLLQLNDVRVGAVVYTVPGPITDYKATFRAIRWIIDEARDRPREEKQDQNRLFAHKLAEVLLDSANNTGKVVAKKQEYHRVAEQNRAYAHYRKMK